MAFMKYTSSLFVIAIFLVSPLNSLVTLVTEGLTIQSTWSGTTIKNPRVDIDALDWINLKELKLQHPKIYNFNFPNIKSPVICIMDSGLDSELWHQIATDFGVNAAESITYVTIKKIEFLFTERYRIRTFIYMGSAIWEYKADSLSKIYNLPDSEEDLDIANKHGSSITYLLKSLAPNIKLLIVRLEGFRYKVKDKLKFSFYPYSLADALELLYKGKINYIEVDGNTYIFLSPDILSLSLTGGRESDFKNMYPSAYKKINKYLKLLYDNGVDIFAAAGNKGESFSYYPASLDYTYSVSAIMDNDDQKPGYKPSRANYGYNLDCVAPGVTIKTKIYDGESLVGVRYNGTSFSTPIAALTFAYTKYAARVLYNRVLLKDNFNIEFRKRASSWVYRWVRDAFYIALENTKDIKFGVGVTPKPVIKSKMFLDYSKKFYIGESLIDANGYGCVDVYDSVNFIGFLVKTLVGSRKLYYPNGWRSVSFEVNITLSHHSYIANNMYKKYMGETFSFVYEIFDLSNSKRLIKKDIVSANRIKAHGSFLWVVYKVSLNFYVKSGSHYLIKLYWDFSQAISFLYFNDVLNLHVYGLDLYIG